jgi:hypothetical protein
MLTIGGLSRKASFHHLFRRAGWQQPARPAPAPAAVVVTASPLASWNIGPDITPGHRRWWAVGRTLTALDSVFFHVLDVPVLAGLWLFRRRFALVPGAWLLLVTGVVLSGLAYRLGVSSGYVSGRHVLLIGLGGVFWGVAGLAGIAGWLGRRLPRWDAPRIALGLLLAVALLPLPKTLARLHAERVGFRQAGEWLARNAPAGDRVLDPFAWSRYHAGRVFTADRDDLPCSDPGVAWVIVERSRSKHAHLWYLVEPARQLAEQGELVRRFEVRRGRHKGTVEIYRVPLQLVPENLHPALG